MMPDHVPEFAILFCASVHQLKQENEITARANQRVATSTSNADYNMGPGRLGVVIE